MEDLLSVALTTINIVSFFLRAIPAQSYLLLLRSDHYQLYLSDVFIFSKVVIPGQRLIILRSLSTSYTWIANVEARTPLLFFMTDSQGRQGGVSNLDIVANSTDTSCLVGNSSSPTASSPSQAPSQSASPVINTTTVDIIVGAAISGVILLVLLTIRLRTCYKRDGQTTHASSKVTRLFLVLR